MVKELIDTLQLIINNLKCGNSNVENEEELYQIVDALKRFTDKDKLLSKYQAYTLLNMSRAKFDNKVKEGILPKGIKVEGFKELMWKQSELNKIIKENKIK